MQVYLVIWSDHINGKRMIIGRKRWLNAFWQGSVQKPYVALNQSGQYALNGGKAEAGGAVDEALREFREETGLDGSMLMANELYANTDYTVVAAKPKPDTLNLDELKRQMHNNVAINSVEPDKPCGSNVVDWEFAGFEIVDVTRANEMMGVEQAIPDEWMITPKLKFTKAEIRSAIKNLETRNKWSQSIDWYAEIAKELPAKLN